MGVDATDLFDHYEEEYEELVGGGFPAIEINKMHISQSIEVCDFSEEKTYLNVRVDAALLNDLAKWKSAKALLHQKITLQTLIRDDLISNGYGCENSLGQTTMMHLHLPSDL